MRKNRTIISLLSATACALLLLISYSCSEEFFDEIPGDKITPDMHYKTAIEVNVSYLGVFSLLQDVSPNLIITNGLLADLVNVTENADLQLKDINRHTINSNNPYTDGSGLYRIIIMANEVLANIDSTIQDPDFTADDYNLVRGNLIGLRSWAYFTIARLYGEAAYIPDNVVKLENENTFIYLPREVMLDTLIQHLDSLVLMSDFFGSGYRINNHALLGEIYLEKEDYELAADYLFLATSTAGKSYYKVDARYGRDKWKDIFVNSDSKVTTVLAAVPFSRVDQQVNMIENYTSFDYEYAVKPSDSIISLFERQLTKRNELGDLYRGVGFSYDTLEGNYMINKYSLESNDFNSAVILYRAADIHLLLAEAFNRLGDPESALKIVNDGLRTLPYWALNQGVRGRVYLQTLDPGPGDMLYIEDLIMQERSMELAFEGKRWFDLMRIARRRNDNSYLADKVALKFSDPAMAADIKSRLMVESNWYLPVVK